MELQAARTLAIALMADHGISHWNFAFDRAEQRLGLCTFRTRTISMGAPFVLSADVEAVTQTMLHEIAHAIVGAGAGHGPRWSAKARSIGYNGRRTADNPHHSAKVARDLEAAQAAVAEKATIVSGPLTAGERIVSNDGRYRGVIVSVARVNIVFLDDRTSKRTRIAIHSVVRENGGAKPVAPTSRRQTGGGLITGQRVAINLPGHPRHSDEGELFSIGPKNFRIAMDIGGPHMVVPRSLVRAA